MIRSVKKLLIILMLLVLPLQFTWAAAAVYCQHETRSATRHLGHHEHKHQADAGALNDASNDAANDQEKPAQAHIDCGYCHAASQASFAAPASPLVIPSGSIHIELPSLSFSSHIPDGPRRPDRHPVA